MKRPTKDYQNAHQIEQPTMIGQYLKDVEKYMDYQDELIKKLTTPNKNELRLRAKKAFICNNLELVNKCFNQDPSHTGHKTNLGIELIEKARKALSYSVLTYNGDIYYGIMNTFKNLDDDLRS